MYRSLPFVEAIHDPGLQIQQGWPNDQKRMFLSAYSITTIPVRRHPNFYCLQAVPTHPTLSIQHPTLTRPTPSHSWLTLESGGASLTLGRGSSYLPNPEALRGVITPHPPAMSALSNWWRRMSSAESNKCPAYWVSVWRRNMIIHVSTVNREVWTQRTLQSS